MKKLTAEKCRELFQTSIAGLKTTGLSLHLRSSTYRHIKLHSPSLRSRNQKEPPMSEYSMSVLSEQERDKLTDYCKYRISELAEYSLQAKCLKIALATLTAKPVAIEAEVNGVISSVTNSAERISLMSYEKG